MAIWDYLCSIRLLGKICSFCLRCKKNVPAQTKAPAQTKIVQTVSGSKNTAIIGSDNKITQAEIDES